MAAQNGFVDAVKLLLSRGARTNTATTLGFSPLFVATAYKHCDCITALLDAGADIEVRNCHDFTPLISCGSTGFIAGATLLLDADADIEAEKNGGMTALLEAIFHGRTKFVEFIIERGANLAARCSIWDDVPEATALHVAVFLRKRRMVETLLRYGADLSGRDGRGRTAEELAKETGQHSLSQFLSRRRQINVSVSTDLHLPELKAIRGLVPAAGRIDEKGEVINYDGNAIGKVNSGSAKDFVDFIVTKEGNILDFNGRVVGTAELVVDPREGSTTIIGQAF